MCSSTNNFDTGKLESGFFVGNGAIIFLFGIIVILMSCIGCQGIDNQTMKFGSLDILLYTYLS